jgi:hypothetical protein
MFFKLTKKGGLVNIDSHGRGGSMRKIKIFVVIVFLIFQLAWVFSCKEAGTTYPQLVIPNGQSYDFSTSIFGPGAGGDFYFYCDANKPYFWANNLGQRGLVDVGEQDVDLADVTIPAAGYYQQGVPSVADHVYVSYAQEGEEGHYIIFRTLAVTVNASCTIEWFYK